MAKPEKPPEPLIRLDQLKQVVAGLIAVRVPKEKIGKPNGDPKTDR